MSNPYNIDNVYVLPDDDETYDWSQVTVEPERPWAGSEPRIAVDEIDCLPPTWSEIADLFPEMELTPY